MEARRNWGWGIRTLSSQGGIWETLSRMECSSPPPDVHALPTAGPCYFQGPWRVEAQAPGSQGFDSQWYFSLLCSVCAPRAWASPLLRVSTLTTSRNAVVAEENQQSSLPTQPCLVICPLHCRGSSGNTAAVPDGTSKKSQLRGPADSHLYSPTRHSKEWRGASVSFFSHPKEINMLCKNNSIQQSSTLHLPPSGPSLLAFH